MVTQVSHPEHPWSKVRSWRCKGVAAASQAPQLKLTRAKLAWRNDRLSCEELSRASTLEQAAAWQQKV